MPKNTNTNKTGQILIKQQIPKLKNIKFLNFFSTFLQNYTQATKFKPNQTLFDRT